MRTALKVIAALVALWIGAAFLRGVAGGSQTPGAEPAAAQQRVEIVSLTCDPNHGRTRADITIRNTGSDAIRHAKVFVKFAAGANDGYLDPNPLPAGSLGSGTVYSPTTELTTACTLIALQDGDGNPIAY